MALGDGDTWDETQPTDATNAVQIDDYERDLRKGVRSRMALEHEWPASQSATSQAGMHKFVTLQNQASKPTLAGTQVGAVYQKTSNLYYENSAGTEIQITTNTGIYGAYQAKIGSFSRDVSLTTPLTISGLAFTPKIVSFLGGSNGSVMNFDGIDDGTTHVCKAFIGNDTANAFVINNTASIIARDGTASYNQGYVSTFIVDGFVINWIKVGSPAATVSVAYKAEG